MSEQVVSDFKGKDELLIQSIDSLLEMDAKGILVPHGIGGHARTLLRAAKASILSRPAPVQVPDGWKLVPVIATDRMVAVGMTECHDLDACDVSILWTAMAAAAPAKEGK